MATWLKACPEGYEIMTYGVNTKIIKEYIHCTRIPFRTTASFTQALVKWYMIVDDSPELKTIIMYHQLSCAWQRL